MRVTVTIAAVFFCVSTLYGQAGRIAGRIIDNDDWSPIPGAIVQVKDSAGAVICYTFTDNGGSFNFTDDIRTSGTVFHVQSMGYRSFVSKTDSLAFPLTVRMTSEPTVLDDVVVKAPPIELRSDTLVYFVSQYAKAQDNSIVDVLRRLPGIEVEEDGQIKYNGEPINKFYIDGSDFMGGRYGLATENISPSDVARVEVLENHQPIQVLKGLEFSQQAGLNIKLRDDAKRKWAWILNGGIGVSPILYDASAFAMRIAGKWQNMETVRVNNTGWNPATWSVRQTDDMLFGSGYVDSPWTDYISVGRYSSPLDERRTRDNLSLLANTSNSWHSGKGHDVAFNVTYERDRLDYSNGYVTEYFGTGQQPFVEQNDMRTQKQLLSGEVSLLMNRPELYVKDRLYVDAAWNSAASDISGTLGVRQHSETPSFMAANDLQLIKRIGDNLMSVSSRNRYGYKPHSLTVDNGQSVMQEIITGDFRSVTEARYGWLLGGWSIYLRGGIDLNLHDVRSSLTGIDAEYMAECDMSFLLFKAWLAPEFSWQSNRWLFTLSAPTAWNLHRISSGTDASGVYNYPSVSPSVYTRFRISAKTDIAAQLKYSLLPPDASMYFDGLLMTDFRNLYRTVPIARSSQERSAALTFRYRNPISAFFANLSAKFEWDAFPYMMNQLFIGDRILSTFSETDNDSRILQLSGGISKGLISGRLLLNLDAGYGQSWAVTMRENIASPYTVRAVSVQPGIQGTFTRWLSMNYKLTYTYNNMDIKNAGNTSYDILKHWLGVDILIGDKWQIGVGGEHYYTRFNSGRSANLFLLDASVRWKVSRRVDLRLIAMNLLDERTYRYTDYGLLSGTDYTYGIRGRSIMASIQIML